jgi:hypothetical protein
MHIKETGKFSLPSTSSVKFFKQLLIGNVHSFFSLNSLQSVKILFRLYKSGARATGKISCTLLA